MLLLARVLAALVAAALLLFTVVDFRAGKTSVRGFLADRREQPHWFWAIFFARLFLAGYLVYGAFFLVQQ